MSTRGIIFLAVGMLLLGLLIGALSGGVAGYFMAQSSRPAVGQVVPPILQPGTQSPLPFSPRDLGRFDGVRVVEVTPDSPAAKAGLQVGDVITAVSGTKIDADHSLAELIQAKKPGDKVELAVTRGTQSLTITVELGAAAGTSSAGYLGIHYAPNLPGGGRFRLPNG
jgi:S1-C subfamily serine protease